jgi:hypothetical protein
MAIHFPERGAKRLVTPPDRSASQEIDQRIRELGDWRGPVLERMRALIHEADPEGQLWARAMADTLLEANRLASAARDSGCVI